MDSRRAKHHVTSVVILFLLSLLYNPGLTQSFSVGQITTASTHTFTIHDVYEDSIGFVWLATNEGLHRYNGKYFVKTQRNPYSRFFQVSSGASMLVDGPEATTDTGDDAAVIRGLRSVGIDPGELIDTQFNPLDGSSWLLTIDGVFVYSNAKATLVRVENFQESYANCVLAIIGTTVTLITPYGRIYAYNPQESAFSILQQSQSFSFVTKSLKHNDSLTYILADGKLFHVTSDGIKIPDWNGFPSNVEITDIQSFGKSILVGTRTHGLWLGKPAGRAFLFRRVLNGNEPHRVEYPGFNYVTAMRVARNGNVWLVGDGELWLLKMRAFSRLSSDLPMITYEQIAFLDNGKIFVDGDNALYECTRNAPFEYSAKETTRQLPAIQSFIAAHKNKLWISASDYKVYSLENGALKVAADLGYRGETVFHMYPDSAGNVWVMQAPGDKPITGLLKISAEGKITDYNENEGFKSRMLALKQGRDKAIYCAGIGENSYLYKYDSISDSFSNISVKMRFAYDANFEVHDLALGSDSTIWLASTAGLLKFRGNSIVKIYPDEPDEQEAYSVLVDQDGAVWFGTASRGIGKYKDGQMLFYDTQAGLATNFMSYRSLSRTADGTIWAGTREGFFYSHPDFRIQNVTKPPVVLGVYSQGKKDDSRSYSYKSSLTFDYVALSHPISSIRYSYWLGEEDSRWIELSNSDTLLLRNLRDGDYTLQLRAKQAGAFGWSEPTIYSFTVEQVWYLKPFMLIAYFLLSGVLMFTGLRAYNHKKIREKELLNLTLERLVEERTAQLQSAIEELKAREEKIHMQNDELLSQQEELASQNEELYQQREELELRNNALELSKRQQLDLYTQLILEKSEIINRVTQELQTFKQGDLTDQKSIEKFNEMLQSHILTEDEWEKFKATFNQVYPGFFAALRFRFPEITPSELRLAALIKMNINIKEASYMLGISSISVKKSRYRLKKRLALPEEDSLDDFIKRIA